MNNAPLVSICVPVYNCKPFIEKTLESVLAQSYSNFELIVQDNCSNDGTTEIIQSFIKKANDPRIIYHRNDVTVRVEENWNTAIQKGKGKYVKLLCADDLIDVDCLESQVQILENPENIDVILTCSQRRIIDSNDKVLFQKWKIQEIRGRLNRDQVLQVSVRHSTNIFGEPCAVLFRSNVFSKTSGFRDRLFYVIDIDFFLRLLEFGSVYFDNRVLCSFRIHKSSGTSTTGLSQIKQSLTFFREVYLQNSETIGWFNYYCGCLKGFILGMLRIAFVRFLS